MDLNLLLFFLALFCILAHCCSFIAKSKVGEAKGKKKTKKKNTTTEKNKEAGKKETPRMAKGKHSGQKVIMTWKCKHSRVWHRARDAALARGLPDVDILYDVF